MYPPETIFLVVDDSDSMREGVRKALVELGFKNIVEAEDGKKALVVLEATSNASTPIAVVISDWNMPNMTGIEFLKKVRINEKWKQLPFLMLTSASQVNEVVEAISAGVSNYLVKPLEAKVLREKLAGVWQKYNSPQK